MPVTFSNQYPLQWDFGDGAHSQQGTSVTHAFARGGRYVVKGLDGKQLAEEITVFVSPRAIAHLVPTDAEWAVLSPRTDGLAQSVDAAEKIIGPEAVQRWLSSHPLQAWALEQNEQGSATIDRDEGLALFGWSEVPEARCATVGVLDDEKALRSLRESLEKSGWSFVNTIQGLHRFETETRALDVFVDRGAIYAVDTFLTERVPSAQARVSAMPTTGISFDPQVASAFDALPSGAIVTWRRSTGSQLVGMVRFEAGRVTWEGQLLMGKPAWSSVELTKDRLLSSAPQGPLILMSSAAALGEFAEAIDSELLTTIPQLRDGLAAMSGVGELAMYFDVEGFVRATLAGKGLPEPRVNLLLEAGVRQPLPVKLLVDALLERWGVDLTFGSATWSGTVREMPLTVRLTESRLTARGGGPLIDRPLSDLRSAFGQELAAGHIALRIDLAKLREELLLPRRLEGVDPRRALVAQAAAVTVLDRITRVDTAVAVLKPTATGASFEVTLTLR